MKQKGNINILARIHGLYFSLTGLWPLIHMGSFLFVTGPKTDLWLVETVGTLILFIGLGLLSAGLLKQVSLPIAIIAVGTSLGLIVIDITYVWLDVILPVYLLDALVECVLLISWSVYIYRAKLWSNS